MLRTLIVLGSRYHNAYVHENIYKLAKEFSRLVPAQCIHENSIISYEVSHAHICRGGCADGHYHVEVDDKETFVRSIGFKNINPPVLCKLFQPPNPNEFSKMTIYQQQRLPSFLIKESASFSHCEYIDDRLSAQMEGWGYQWKVVCQKQWVCPYYSMGDVESIVFRCRPVYSVHIEVNGLPTQETIQKFVHTGLPRYFWGTYL
jgi:hypothetical protein